MKIFNTLFNNKQIVLYINLENSFKIQKIKFTKDGKYIFLMDKNSLLFGNYEAEQE